MRSRALVLASPVFAGAVALLALNDHVLKRVAPGLVTGKLSDFAGLLVIAVLLTVITGSRMVGTALGGAGLIIVKTVPGASIVVSPLLGGVTRTDPSDLVALVVLVPAWWWLGRNVPSRPGEARLVLATLGAGACMLTVTATSCPSVAQVSEFARAGDGSLLAGVVSPSGGGHAWATTTDGREWRPTSLTPGRKAGGRGEVCIDDGTCFRAIPDRGVEYRPRGERWQTAVRFTPEQVRRRNLRVTRCAGTLPLFGSVDIAGTGTQEHVVVAMGSDGVLWRATDGHWERRPVLNVDPTRLDGPSWVGDLARWTLLAACVLLAGLVLLNRALTGRWSVANPGILVAAVGTGVILALGFFSGYGSGIDYMISGPLIVACAIATFVASAVVSLVAHRRARSSTLGDTTDSDAH